MALYIVALFSLGAYLFHSIFGMERAMKLGMERTFFFLALYLSLTPHFRFVLRKTAEKHMRLVQCIHFLIQYLRSNFCIFILTAIRCICVFVVEFYFCCVLFFSSLVCMCICCCCCRCCIFFWIRVRFLDCIAFALHRIALPMLVSLFKGNTLSFAHTHTQSHTCHRCNN